jgi:hypothetical protein
MLNIYNIKIKSILSVLFFCIFVSSVSSQSSNTNNTEQNTRAEIFIKYDGVYFMPYAGDSLMCIYVFLRMVKL